VSGRMSKFQSGNEISVFRKLELVFGSDVWECGKWSGVERRGLQEPRFLLGGEREGSNRRLASRFVFRLAMLAGARSLAQIPRSQKRLARDDKA
jgi:hypothetical protein